jgi:hypothetical protein
MQARGFEVLGFPDYLQVNAEIVSQIGHDHLLPYPLQFIIPHLNTELTEIGP